ncbi:hypothetical protein [Streptomyces sp. NPDC094468]|uniref:hypothetical protein n=1 Tax=Streptomyces sp. NPDC094468 TaxID=3366066 RepID=UPI00380D7B89
MSLTAIVALALAIVVVALVRRDEKLGIALTTAAAVLGAVYLLLGTQPAEGGESPNPTTSGTPFQAPAAP